MTFFVMDISIDHHRVDGINKIQCRSIKVEKLDVLSGGETEWNINLFFGREVFCLKEQEKNIRNGVIQIFIKKN